MESPISQKGNPVISSFSPKLKMPTAYLPPESGRISVNAPGHSYGPVMRPYHIMHFITGGEGCLEIGGKRFRLGKGDVFYLPEDEICYYYASRVTPWSYSWCAFCGRKAADFQYQFSSLSPDDIFFAASIQTALQQSYRKRRTCRALTPHLIIMQTASCWKCSRCFHSSFLPQGRR
jgi:hypothetical protein